MDYISILLIRSMNIIKIENSNNWHIYYTLSKQKENVYKQGPKSI